MNIVHYDVTGTTVRRVKVTQVCDHNDDHNNGIYMYSSRVCKKKSCNSKKNINNRLK